MIESRHSAQRWQTGASAASTPRAPRAAVATLAYVALTIALTWPVARHPARDVAGDLVDPLLNAWILAWDATHLLSAFGGHLHALAGYWSANIFYPQPLTLAYSEHLTAQALQILPVYALTRNPILCYNLLLLSTFVLSGLGMFLFVGELTGSAPAAFVAGLAYAFAPYRFGSIPHVQVLSSAWMPFALFGFRRYFDTRRTGALVFGAAAWLAQNLSCSYYLLFFAPIVAAYLAWELTVRRRWRDASTLVPVLVASTAVALATFPFVLPYYELRQLGFPPRPFGEIDHFSADVRGFLTADDGLRFWGRIARGSPKPEGALFPGVTIVALAALAIVDAWRGARSAEHGTGWPGAKWLARALAAAIVVAVAMLLGWSIHAGIGPVSIKMTDVTRVLLIAAGLGVALMIASPPTRRASRRWLRTPIGLVALLTLFAAVMSLGPHVDSGGKTLAAANLYTIFYRWVPGYDGLRVPARFGMIVAFGLATLAGYGVARIGRGTRGGLATVAAAVLIVAESFAVPVPINFNDTAYRRSGLAPLPAALATGDAAPPVYRFVATLPASAVLVEFPFGEPAFEVRDQFYSTLHWRRLVNGYSGGAPLAYGLLAEDLGDVFTRPDAAWRALAGSGATHAIVHEQQYAGDGGTRTSAWLRRQGAREIARFGPDRVFALPR